MSTSVDEQSDRPSLHDLCRAFIDKHKIRCPEACYDDDQIYIEMTTLLECICDRVGYYKDPDSDEI